MGQRNFDELREIYLHKKRAIEDSWQKRKQSKTEDEMFAILVSCILSSKAKWSSVKKVMAKVTNGRILFEGSAVQLIDQLTGLSGRYVNTCKLAEYIVDARQSFPFIYMIVSSIQANEIKLEPAGISSRDIGKTIGDQFLHALNQRGISPDGLRELVLVFKGIGDKQASHFLATVGFECYAILDVHVNKKLVKYGVISEEPKSLTRAKYREIESKMKDFARTVDIPFHHLDTLLWELGSGNDISAT
ncbi:MAG: hypothetical protein AABZ10_00500 [Nitrospirota bacterium]